MAVPSPPLRVLRLFGFLFPAYEVFIHPRQTLNDNYMSKPNRSHLGTSYMGNGRGRHYGLPSKASKAGKLHFSCGALVCWRLTHVPSLASSTNVAGKVLPCVRKGMKYGVIAEEERRFHLSVWALLDSCQTFLVPQECPIGEALSIMCWCTIVVTSLRFVLGRSDAKFTLHVFVLGTVVSTRSPTPIPASVTCFPKPREEATTISPSRRES